jgi:diguanylate cyclase (GGDEF)-like protein
MTITGVAPAEAAGQVSDLLDRAERARLAGDYRGGSELAGRAAALAEADGDNVNRARALRSMANQLLRLGEQEAAIKACRDALPVLEAIGDQAGVGDVLVTQSMPLNDLGLHEEALLALDRAREIAQQLQDHDLLYWAHNRTGVVHGTMGNRALSTDYLRRALSMADGMDAEARFCILNNVGDNAVHLVAELRADGRTEAAAAALSESIGHVAEALRLARAAGHPYRQSISLDNYGMLLALGGDYRQAEQLIEEARTLAAAHGYRALESGALQHQAQVRLMRGECAAAVTGLHAALERALAAGETPLAMEINRELSDAYELVGDPAAALRHYREYHRLERTAHNDVAAARARMAVHDFELDNARLEADNARLEAELHRLRAAELEADKLALQQQATEDPLTGLPNRRYAELRLPALIATGGPVCVAVADVDKFKDVNDRFGHPVGDQVLRQIASILQSSVRDSDLVARLGGEEFLIGLDGLSPAEAAARCELLRAGVAAYDWESLQSGLAVTISLGVAPVLPGDDLKAAVKLADERLYAAKRAGRNRVDAG